jgi:hypothetical protein
MIRQAIDRRQAGEEDEPGVAATGSGGLNYFASEKYFL